MPAESQPIAIIPLPAEIDRQAGVFTLTTQTVIVADEANQWNAAYLRNLLCAPTGFDLPVLGSSQNNFIELRLGAGAQTLGEEGYHLSVSGGSVVIEAPARRGIFYGIQTLRQLLPIQIEERGLVQGVDWAIPCVEIADKPRFPWRGYMLDEGRHFQGKQAVLRALDLMALQKLNIFHWHLTEDQGWRIEIKQYPRLTEIGSRRAGTSKGFLGQHDGIPHGGFYTQDDIRAVVTYAAERHILVVPEIEMPGHALAALAAYPELSCTGAPFEVATHFGIYPDVYCPGKEAVFTFLQAVLDEVLALFPSPYIHIGGDETPTKRWEKCPDCQQRIRQEGLKDAHGLQVYFVNRIAAYLAGHGRRVISWNESLQTGLAEDVLIQYWIGSGKKHEKALAAVRDEKRPLVMSAFFEAYLDHSHDLTPLSRAYRYEPVFPELDPAQAASILGLEAPLWGEFVRNPARVDYQTYPRLCAYAETGWTPRAAKDFVDFSRRLDGFLPRLKILGVRYAPLAEAEPSFLKQRLGIFTIATPQTRIAE